MEEQSIIKKVYYIPENVRKGGNFYHTFNGIGDNLPYSIEELLPYDITIDEVSSHLKNVYNLDIRKASAEIVPRDLKYIPFVAYAYDQDNFISRTHLIKQAMNSVKAYCSYVAKDSADEYSYQKRKNLL